MNPAIHRSSQPSLAGAAPPLALALTALLLAAAVAPPVAAASGPPKSGQFDQIEAQSSPGYTSKLTEHFTFKGARFRFDGTDPNTLGVYENIMDGQNLYVYYPDQKAAVKVATKELPKSPLDELQSGTAQKLDQAVKMGQTVVNGFDCDVYVRDFGNGTKATVYLSKDPRFPYVVKTVLSNPAQQTSETSSIDNVKLDVPVADDTFTIPTGTKIVERPADLTGGAGGAPAAGAGAALPAPAAGQ